MSRGDFAATAALLEKGLEKLRVKPARPAEALTPLDWHRLQKASARIETEQAAKPLSPEVVARREALLAKVYAPKPAPSPIDEARRLARLKKGSVEGQAKYVITAKQLAERQRRAVA